MNKRETVDPRPAVLAALFLLGGATFTPAVAEQALSWQRGPSTREAENGTILENDLNYVPGNGQQAANYYPQAAVVSWPPIPTNQPGRYRVSLRARTEKLGPSSLVLQAWVRPEQGGLARATGHGVIPIPLAVLPLNGVTFVAPGQWQEFSLDFDVEADKPVSVGLMYLGADRPCAVGKVQVEALSLRLDKLDVPVTISWARPVKLRYRHNESGQLELRLTNASDEPRQVEARPVVITDTDARRPGKPRTFTVPPKRTIAGTLPFDIPAEDGGYAAVAELMQDGKSIGENGDVFAVSDSPFQFMLSGGPPFPYWLMHAHHLGLKGFRERVLDKWDRYATNRVEAAELMRRSYCTYVEWFAWAREDATVMVEDSDEPYLSGQVFYPVSRKQILLLNGLMKAHGIAPSAYLNACPFGWPGFEVFRQHPEWFELDPVTGQPSAQFDTAVMERYLKGETVGGNVYPVIGANYDAVSPRGGQTYLQYHMDQLVRSVQLYGWEAFRYDAGPLPTNAFPTVKARLAALNPPVGIGNNQGICCLGTEPTAIWNVYCRDGSLMMEEDITFAFYRATDPHRRWLDWIDYLRRGSHLARSNGGHYTFINNGNWISSALGYAVGGHPHPYQFHKNPFGDSERFMLRYGFIFWDLRTRMLAEPEKIAQVVSARPLWWKPLVSQRALSAKHRQVLFPLFNPPAEEEVVGTTITGAVEGAVLTFAPTPKETVSAWLLTPEPVARRMELPLTRNGDRVSVTVPRFWGWTTVVFDCENKSWFKWNR
ncbi:MAG: hypothetical protein PHR35_12365 [Kiritimatiellae bacterium]|nr:hypothetical protein [Kiritimatiellia bacterium]